MPRSPESERCVALRIVCASAAPIVIGIHSHGNMTNAAPPLPTGTCSRPPCCSITLGYEPTRLIRHAKARASAPRHPVRPRWLGVPRGVRGERDLPGGDAELEPLHGGEPA